MTTVCAEPREYMCFINFHILSFFHVFRPVSTLCFPGVMSDIPSCRKIFHAAFKSWWDSFEVYLTAKFFKLTLLYLSEIPSNLNGADVSRFHVSKSSRVQHSFLSVLFYYMVDKEGIVLLLPMFRYKIYGKQTIHQKSSPGLRRGSIQEKL